MLSETIIKRIKKIALNGTYVHASNLYAKVRDLTNSKEKSETKEKQLEKIIPKYFHFFDSCKKNEVGIDDIENIKKLTNSLNEYYDFVKEVSTYSSQSKLQSSILEEFLYLLFKKEVQKLNTKSEKNFAKSGAAEAYTNLYFIPDPRVDDFKFDIGVHKKKQDYAIFREIHLSEVFHKNLDIKTEKKNGVLNIPIVAIECKTYLDKTMLDGSIAIAEKLKYGNPQSLYLIVAEEYDISESVDPSYSRIDQIYILRKTKKIKKKKGVVAEQKKPFQPDVVQALFQMVYNHLHRNRESIVKKIEKKGFVI